MPRKRWNRKKIIAELKRHRQDRPICHPQLDAAARRYFRSLRAALKVARLPCGKRPPPYNEWSKQLVIQMIRQRTQEGKLLDQTYREDPSLYSAGKRLFGNWSAARNAAGHPHPSREFYTADEVRLRIIELYENELPVTLCSYKELKMRRSVKKHFGSWRRAVESLGLGSELRRMWTDQAVIDAILHRRASGLSLYKTYREDKGLFCAAVCRFGNWHNALKAAGIEAQGRENWSKERIIERLQEIAQTDSRKNVRAIDLNVAIAAQRRFGSLGTALEVARATSLTKRWSKERIVKAIQKRFDEGAPTRIIGFGDIRLALAAKRHFCTWASAVEAAGLADRVPIKKVTPRLTKSEVVNFIKDWCTAGKPLSDILKSNAWLERSARRHFGTWKTAVEAAGFESKRRCWSRDVIVSEIKQRLKENKSLSSADRTNVNLAAAAARHFGSWTAALREAGVSTKPRTSRRSK